MARRHGLHANMGQIGHLLVQVLLVGMTLGLMRTVVPTLAEASFGVARDSFLLLGSFVVAFGVVKSVMNLIAGRLSERWGRQRVLLLGWISALPIPLVLAWAPSWGWIVLATTLLGVHQGLSWSMTQTAKLDLSLPEERGRILGLNEFAGYLGMALAGVITAYGAVALGAREALLAWGSGVIGLGLILTHGWIKDTRPWVTTSVATPVIAAPFRAVFAKVSWQDRRLAALAQAGLVEKFVDALVWVIYPVFLHRQGLALPDIGWVIGTYGVVWGVAQVFTGRLSDRIGRQRPNVWGMLICGTGVMLMVVVHGVWGWSLAAGLSGFGMALLYPNLSAAVADLAAPAWRGTALGVYRFWRDLGYGIGALGLGLAAHLSQQIEAAFVFVALSMAVSAALLAYFGTESHPKFTHPTV
ncbi:MAG: MFS transporter [Leptothrix ochracea]|uniref:MFS transporter n=1 Tax=Leptothrix ochracea TaxID=735331 RepID=UPI0034E2AEB4